MRRVVFFLAVLVPIAMLVSGVAGSQASVQEDVIEQFRAIAGIEELGGKVERSPLEPAIKVDLNGNRFIADRLSLLEALKDLQELQLGNTRISDAGLAHLKGLKNLRSLNLSDTRISDTGLAHLDELNNLSLLGLRKTRISDAGLAHLAWMPTEGKPANKSACNRPDCP